MLKIGDPSARHILVLNPGTSAGSAYFKPLANDIVRLTEGRWQVWSVERRENQLEDQSVLDQFKQGQVTTTTALQLLPGLADRLHRQEPLPADPRLVGRLRPPLGDERRDRGPAPGRRSGARTAGAPSCSVGTHSADRSPPPTRPGTSTAPRVPRSRRSRLHRRRQRPGAGDARGRRPSRCKPQDEHPMARVRRHPGSVSGPLLRGRIVRARSIDPDAPSIGLTGRRSCPPI